jgi:hypothetical protein
MAKKPILNVDVNEEVVGYGKTAASEVVAGPVQQVWTPLFLLLDRNMDLSDKSFISRVESSSSEEDSEDKEDEIEEADEMDIDQTLRD